MIGAPGSAPDPNALPSLANAGFQTLYIDVAGQTQKSSPLVGGQNTVVLLCYGQSLLANYNADSYSVVSSLNQYLSIVDGGIYLMTGTMLGCSWSAASANRMSYLQRLGDKLISDSYCARVIVCNVAVGSTLIADWASGGGCNALLTSACTRLALAGLTPANVYKFFIMQHQGESQDAVTSAAYAASGNSALSTIRNFSWQGATPFSSAKAFVATASYNVGTTSSAVTGGQALMVDGVNTFAGPNVDSIPAGSRVDNTHLNATGCATITTGASMWSSIIEAH